MPSWEHFSHDADIGLVGIGTGGGGQGRDLDRSERCARGRWMARDVCREQVSNVATLRLVRQAFAAVLPPAHLTQFYDVSHNTCNLEEHPGAGASKSVGVRHGGSYAEKLR